MYVKHISIEPSDEQKIEMLQKNSTFFLVLFCEKSKYNV